MPVPLSSADLSQPGAGDALGAWEQVEVAAPRIHVPPTSTLTTTEAAASESDPPAVPLSDAELLAAFVQRRDADAFTEIVQRYRLLVYRVALRAVDDRHLADDVFQATFLVLARSAHKIKSGEALAAWLHGTTRNIARRALATQYAEQKQLTDWAKQTLAQKGEEMATSTEADPFEELTRRHEQQLLDEELQQLPEASRAPLVLFYLEKKSQAEIAQLMGLSVEAVEGRLKRAKQELRTRLIRRGVLLSTVVAAATVLTPAITAAAPTASLVSATITTALGTAALGSTALGATAVTGAATSSKLAAGSATATTLAAQEIVLMSVTSKATMMLITTAASTTLVTGLVLGAMVGTFSMGSGASVQSDGLSMAELVIPQEINSDALGPNLLSSEVDDLVQIALVEPEETTESGTQASAQAEKLETLNEGPPIVYQVGDFSAEELKDADDYAQSIGLTVLLHNTTQSFVVRATEENHRKLSDHLQGMRQKHAAKASVQFELFSARAHLAKLLKEFDENHPDVKQARSQIAAIEKAIAEGTNQSRVVEEHEELLDSPLVTAAPEVKEKNDEPQTTENILVTYSVADCISPKLISDLAKRVGKFAESVSYHDANRSLVIKATRANHHKIEGLIAWARESQTYAWDSQYELIWLRKSLSEKQRELGNDAEEVKSLRDRVESVEKAIAAKSPEEQVQHLINLSGQVENRDFAIDQLEQQLNDLKASGVGLSKGLVVEVDQSIVWLNIGSKDNLQPQTTFSVADKSLAGVIRGTQDLKAKLEVIRVHYEGAVARIVEEDPKRPIQAGDSIFSPVWSDDKKTQIAFVGNSDLNGDMLKDRRDRQMLRAVVENARGEITLEVNDEGVRVPADAMISAQTKWLVVGDLDNPLNRANDSAAQARRLAIQKQHNDLVQEAREHGVNIVSIKDFVSYLGWKPNRLRIIGPIFLRGPMSLQLGKERLLTGSTFNLGDVVSVVSDRPDIVQVVDKTIIRAVQDGTANITVTDVNGKTATIQVDVPRQYIRSASLLRQLTPVEKTIYEVLCRQEPLEFPQQTLDQFAESLSAKYQIPVNVDWQALDPAGVSKDATVTFSGLKRIEHALTDILSDVGGKRLEFFVDNGELHFTTQEAMKSTSRTRRYDLSPLTNEQWETALERLKTLFPSANPLGRMIEFEAPLSVHKEFEQFLAMETVTANAAGPADQNADPVRNSLVDPAQKPESAEQPAPKSEVEEDLNRLKPVVYSLEGIGAGNLQKIIEFAESNSDSVSFHTGTHSLVISNTPENHHKFADYVSQIKRQQETDLKHQFEIIAARKWLGAKVKEFGNDHPEVRKAQAKVTKLEMAITGQSQEAQQSEEVAISTTIFQADDAAMEQLADKDIQGRLILLQDSRKKFNALMAKRKVVVIHDQKMICRIGQPNTFFSGGESPLEPLPKDGVGVGQKVESVKSGMQVELTIFDKRPNNGQRVLKYDLQSTLTHSGDNNPKLDGRELPVISGRVFRGYVPLPENESQGTLIGPLETVQRTSAEGALRHFSIYLWIRSE